LVLKLRARDCPEKLIQEIVAALAKEGMQSDTRFAESFVRNRVDRGAGPIRVKAEMLTRGLDDEIMEAALTQYKDWWKDLALEVYKKRYGEGAPADYAEKAKRMAFLQSRGFTVEQIHYALNNADS
jgi:regulatory protein